MSGGIARVGIVAKRGLAAADHLGALGAWLQERGIQAVYEIETAALARVRATDGIAIC